MTLSANGIVIDLVFDSDGFPIINIDTGNQFIDKDLRPTLEITLNSVVIHDFFDYNDCKHWPT